MYKRSAFLICILLLLVPSLPTNSGVKPVIIWAKTYESSLGSKYSYAVFDINNGSLVGDFAIEADYSKGVPISFGVL